MNFKRKKCIHRKNSKINLFLERQLNSSLFTYQSIFSMLLPLIIDVFFVNLISLLTTAMISSSSQDSVSAVSLVNPIAMSIFAIFSAVSVGGTVVVAQYHGQGNMEKLKEAAGQVIMVTSLIATLLSIFLIIFASPLINFIFGTADPIVITKATDYLIGITISLVFLAVYMGVFAIYRGIGNTKFCLYLTIIINFTHLIGSFLFINILKLDIAGTSLSLNIARSLGAIIALYMLFRKKNKFTIQLKHIFSFHLHIIKSILYIGIPFAFELLFFYIGNIIVQAFIINLGTASVAANAITTSVISLLTAPGLAVGTLAITVIAQCTGAGERDLAKKYGSKMIWLATCIVTLSLMVLLPFLPYILYLYQAPTDTLSIIYKLMFISIIPIPLFWSCSNVIPAVLRATGDSTYSSIVSLATMWLVRVGLGYILTISLGFGVYGFALTAGIEWAVKMLIFLHRYRSGVWLDKDTIH